MSTRKKILAAALILALALVAYWISTYFMAYTDNAYVDADLIRIAPVVSGPVTRIFVADNQRIPKGEPLFAIDPSPYHWEEQLASASLAEEKALLEEKNLEVERASSGVTQASSQNELAKRTHERYRKLVGKGDVPQQKFDEAEAELGKAAAELNAAGDRVTEAEKAVSAQEVAIGRAEAELGLARYRLSHTTVKAPENGIVNMLHLAPGDWAENGKPVIGLVKEQSFRVIANFRERLVRHIKPGQTAWVYLDAYPWQIFRGKVQGVARAVSREPGKSEILPYVKPSTDWIRLSRRFPVRITLESVPEDVRLHMGADARVLIVY